ncbi:MAG TPA: hypothetical protein VFZ12_06690 [Dehalococcoidia bacterium]|nr:hypothetical protein [Dehalococcoidia bacterium]
MKRHALALRPWTSRDSQAASAWWHECWQSAGAADEDIPPPGATVQLDQCSGNVLAITLGDAPCGLIVMNDKVLLGIALRADVRGWGYGSEAIGLVEARFSARAVLASPRVGLSLYFWLRLGYAASAEQPYAPGAFMLEKAT